MECLHSRISYASWRLKVFRELFLPYNSLSTSGNACRRTISTATPPQQQEQDAARDPDTTSTNSALQDNSPTVLRPSQLLPQSPLLAYPHPGLAKKHKKRLATHSDLDELRRNPWAMALASPPRMCALTGTRVPRSFLGDWGMVRPPESDEGLWMMPVGLMKDELDLPTPHNKLATETEPPREQFPRRSFHYLILRMVDRLPLIRRLTKALTGHAPGRKVSPIVRVLPFRWKHPHGPITSIEEKQVIWREDMPELVLRQMRSVVLRQLQRVSDKYKRTNAPNGVWRTLELGAYSDSALQEGLMTLDSFARMECGGVLVMGPPSNGDGVASGDDLGPSGDYSGDEDSISDFAFLPQTGSKVPVFDLRQLFSETDMEELRNHHPRFQSSALFFRPDDSATVEVMLALWKLKGLLKDDEPI
ncbi:hypothetical protein FE257_000484 [Aspergillus nanangensis]|uniref:Uncharacterized protein n=1 Tax=Aspergillus nanangensis TaxID=2582783 RepID=A0AAD4CWA6_ASPNN|nr:hypothetical protein FE257_000484 [Aspergillus nanangensis]